MRENMGLFRGKRIDNGKWIIGNLSTPNEVYGNWCISYVDYLNSYGDIGCITIEVIPETVGECCGGLRDKNGKLAFEHDVSKDQLGRRWVIFGCKGGFGICRDTEWVGNADCSMRIYNALADAQNAEWFSHQHEIIGNIHDNSELLKEGADNG